MQLRESTPDVQTLEGSPLDALLDRPYVPPQRLSGVVRRPTGLLPSRLAIVDYLIAKYGYCPPPDLDIEYRSIFYRVTVPTSGKLYVDCMFRECDYEIPTAPYAVMGSVQDIGNLWQHAQRHGFATIKHSLVGLKNG